MKTKQSLLILLVFLALSTYGKASGTNDKNAFIKACDASYNLGRSICECLAKKADERLTSTGFAFLVASMNNDAEKTAKLRSELNMSEAMEAGMFMVNTPKVCSEEIGGN